MKKKGILKRSHVLNIKAMVTNFETVEERIRNTVTPMYNLAHIIKDIRRNDENSEILKNFLLNKADINIILKNIDYLINVGHEVDKVLPKDYSINEHLNYSINEHLNYSINEHLNREND